MPEELRHATTDVCAVCLKGMQAGCNDRVKRLPCQHRLNRDCLLQVVKGGLEGTEGVVPSTPAQPRCPLCRESLFENEEKKKNKKRKQQPGAHRRTVGGEGTAETETILVAYFAMYFRIH